MLVERLRRRVVEIGMSGMFVLVLASTPEALLLKGCGGGPTPPTPPPTPPTPTLPCNGSCASPADADDCAACCGGETAAHDCCDANFEPGSWPWKACETYITAKYHYIVPGEWWTVLDTPRPTTPNVHDVPTSETSLPNPLYP